MTIGVFSRAKQPHYDTIRQAFRRLARNLMDSFGKAKIRHCQAEELVLQMPRLQSVPGDRLADVDAPRREEWDPDFESLSFLHFTASFLISSAVEAEIPST